MRAIRRILGVARVRFLEGARGPLAGFLVLFLAIAAAVAVFAPGEPGIERQRAVDRMVLDAALLVTAFAAAALGATSLAADRAAERDSILDATALRPPELLLGGLLGHGVCLVVLLVGVYAGTLLTTGLLGGGDREPTRQPLFAEGTGGVLLKRPGSATTVRVPIPPERFAEENGEVGVTVRLREVVDETVTDFPQGYDVGVAIGGMEERPIRVARGAPLKFTVPEEAVGPDGRVEIRFRRLPDSYSLGILRSAVVADGPRRSLEGNLAKAAFAWLAALLVMVAAAAAFSTLVQAPVAAAGALLLAVVGHSLGLLAETAGLLRAEQTQNLAAAGFLDAIVAVWPDLDASDMTTPVVARWDIAAPAALGRLLPGLGFAAAFLGFGWLVLEARRRR